MADFLSKSQVQVGGVQEHAVKNLGQDLLGLFGAVGEGAETYNTIGVTAAKLEFQSQMTSATDAITQQKVLLNQYAETNDTDGILNVQNNINQITANVHAKADDFKNHEDAYKEYSNSSADFGARVRSTYTPLISSTYITANKNNVTSANDNLLESSAKANVPITTAIRDNVISTNKANLFDDKENDAWKTKVFTNNFHLLNGEISKSPAYLFNQYNLATPDKDGNNVYNLDGEREMVKTLFGDLYTTDKDGNIISGKSNSEPDAKEMATLGEALGLFRAKVMKPTGSVYSAEFANALKKVNTDLSSVNTGNLTFNAIYNTTAVQTILNTPNSMLSNDQLHEKQVFLLQFKDMQKESTAIAGFIQSAVTSGDFKQLDSAKVLGASLTDGKGYNFNISATRVSAEINNYTTNVNNMLTEAMRSGNSASILPELSKYNSTVYNLTGTELNIVQKAKDVVNGGTKGVVSSTEYKDSISLLLQLTKDGQGVAPTEAGSRVVQNYKMQLDSIKDIEEQFKNDPVGKKAALSAMKAAGINDIVHTSNVNAQGLSTFAMSNMDALFNFGTAQPLSLSEANAMGANAAILGYKITNNDEAKKFISENYTRTKLEHFGKVTYRPNSITDSQADMVINSLTKSAGVRPNQTDYKIRILSGVISDNKNIIDADLMNNNGKIIKSKSFTMSSLTKLVADYSNNIAYNDRNENSTKPVLGIPSTKNLPPLVFPKKGTPTKPNQFAIDFLKRNK